MRSFLKKVILTSSILLLFLSCFKSKTWKYLPESKEEETYLFVVNHGWHTGIIISQKNLGEDLFFLNEYFGISQYYEIGWGDKGFYEADEITTKITLQALFQSTPSVLHIVAVNEHPLLYFSASEVVKVPISQKAHSLLNKNISQSFMRNEKGKVIKTKSGIYGKSFFFTGIEFYNITNTCNTWTARVLENSGLPINSFLTLTAKSVISQTKDAVNSFQCCVSINPK